MTTQHNKKIQTLTQTLNAVATEWDISGGVIVIEKEEILYDELFGFADREQGIPLTRESRYTLDTESNFFIGLCLFSLIDQGQLNLSDKLSKYIPDYPFAKEITLKNLIKSQSGIPDFFYHRIMVDLDQDASYKSLDDTKRIQLEKRLFLQNRSFNQAMQLIEGLPLEYKPGTTNLEGSETELAILAEIIRRVTGDSVFACLKKNIFEPLQMHGVQEGQTADTVSYTVLRHTHLVRLPMDYTVDGLMTVTLDDMKKLLLALGTKKLFSDKMWAAILKHDENGVGLIFENANGYDCSAAPCLGSGFHCYFNHTTGVAFASLVNEQQKLKFTDNTWRYFRRDSRETIASALTYPVNTKIVKVKKDNFWNALNLKVEDDQAEFVLEAKSSIAMGLMYKTKQAYVQMEGNLCVGLLVLDVDKKKDYYHIDIILIDKRFQGRGYGKLMLKWAVEELKKAGAKELKIGVSRHNHGAKKIYMDAGFTPKSIYEEGMELYMRLAPEELSTPEELNGSHYVV